MNPPKPTFDPAWDEVHQSRSWGRYPAEEIVRFIARARRNRNPGETMEILDLGCGGGASTWFLRKEGHRVQACDGSMHALKRARSRLAEDNLDAPLCQADAGALPYLSGRFDLIIDGAVISANTRLAIQQILGECRRVLKPGGLLFSTGLFRLGMWGFGTGEKIEENTYRQISEGPLANIGTVHFFTREEISQLWARAGLHLNSIDTMERTDLNGSVQVAYFLTVAEKAVTADSRQ